MEDEIIKLISILGNSNVSIDSLNKNSISQIFNDSGVPISDQMKLLIRLIDLKLELIHAKYEPKTINIDKSKNSNIGNLEKSQTTLSREEIEKLITQKVHDIANSQNPSV